MAEPNARRPLRYEWDGVMRRLNLSPTIKLVAAYMSQYADTEGRHIRPGIDRLALETGLGEKTIRRSLATLRELGLLLRVRSGASQGRRGQADEYRLSIPDDILDRVDLVAPIAVAVEPSERSANPSPDEPPVDNGARNCGQASGQRPATTLEHRSPDDRSSSRTPVTDDPNTGHQMTAHQPRPRQLPTTRQTSSSSTRTTTHVARTTEPVDNPSRPSERPSTTTTVAVTSLDAANPHQRATTPRCPHGRTTRRRPDGTPRCPDCRPPETDP